MNFQICNAMSFSSVLHNCMQQTQRVRAVRPGGLGGECLRAIIPVMKARYQYRIYPRPTQIEPLAKAFGCSRVVWNDALWVYKNAFKNGEERPKNVDKLVITQAKKTEARAWLSEVSNIVLQQSQKEKTQVQTGETTRQS